MEDYTKKTNQELLTEFNKIADKHSQLKIEITNKLEDLEKLEEEYIKIGQILMERKG
jgi:hypothetical protein